MQDAIEDAVRRASEDGDVKEATLRAIVAQGLADLEAGRVFEGTVDDIIAEAKAEYAAPARK